jgi:hypothetical protein
VFKQKIADRRQRRFSAALEHLETRRLLSVDVATYRNDSGSTAQNNSETVLTPTNVASANFGKLWTRPLDGQIYAQPLVKTNVNVTRGSNVGLHNVLYAATQHGSLYALDANTGSILWQDSFLNLTNPTVLTPTTGVSPIGANTTVGNSGINGSNDTVNTADINPEVGILGTPVIDAGTNIMYLVAMTKEYRSGTTPANPGTGDRHFVQRLWAVNVADGSVALGGPAVIGDTVKNTTIGGSLSQYADYQYFAGPIVTGTGNNAPVNNAATHMNTNADGWIASTDPNHLGYVPSASGQIAFNALLQMDRPAVSLVNGTIYLGYASHGDNGPYYGWILGYGAANLSLTAAFVTCPTFKDIVGDRADFRAQAGVWMSGDRITSDSAGNIYVSTGNGIFDNSAGNFDANGFPIDHDYGDAVLKIAPDPASNFNNQNGNGYGIKVVDYFVPSNAVRLNQIDADMGSGGVLLLPDNAGNIAGHPHLLIAGGKEGRIYLIDRDNMGKFNTAYNSQPTGTDPRAFDRVVGEVPPPSGTNTQNNQFYTTGSYFNSKFYIALAKLQGQVWNVSALNAGVSPPGNSFNPPPLQTTTGNISAFGDRGATFSISANGTSNGIVWALANRNAKNGAGTVITDALIALDAGNFTIPLFNSGSGVNSLVAAGSGTTGVKFSVPTVANGMVYCGTGGVSSANAAVGLGSIVAYGLSGITLNAPSSLAAQTQTTTKIHLTWTRNSTSETQLQIERSPDGVGWTPIALVPNGTTSYDDTTVAPGTHYFYRVKALSGPNPSPYSNTADAFTIFTDTIGPGQFVFNSAPQRITFAFNSDVSATLGPSDILLQNLTSSTTIPTAQIVTDWNAGTNTATFRFPTLPNGGALPNGVYKATLLAAGISGAGFGPMQANRELDFFFVNGDADHNGTVNVDDLNLLAGHWQQPSGATYGIGDLDYDGDVDANDLGILSLNWQYNLSGPLPTLSPAPAPVPVKAPVVRSPTRVIALVDSSDTATATLVR